MSWKLYRIIPESANNHDDDALESAPPFSSVSYTMSMDIRVCSFRKQVKLIAGRPGTGCAGVSLDTHNDVRRRHAGGGRDALEGTSEGDPEAV